MTKFIRIVSTMTTEILQIIPDECDIADVRTEFNNLEQTAKEMLEDAQTRAGAMSKVTNCTVERIDIFEA